MHYFLKISDFCFNTSESSLLFQVILTLLGSFLGFGLSLWLYYKQLKKEKDKEKEQKEQSYIDLLRYYHELLLSIKTYFENQLVNIENFITNQEENLTELLPLIQIANEDFKRLRNIDNRGVFEAWIFNFPEKDSIKEYKNTNSSLDFLEGTKTEITRIFETNTKHCYDQLMQAKQIIDHIPDRLSSIALNLKLELKETRWEDKFYVFIDLNIKEFTELLLKEANFEEINEKFLSPLLGAFLKDYEDTPYADEITMLCRKARVKLNDVRVEMQQVLNEYKKTKDRIRKPLNVLDKTLNKIDKLILIT